MFIQSGSIFKYLFRLVLLLVVVSRGVGAAVAPRNLKELEKVAFPAVNGRNTSRIPSNCTPLGEADLKRVLGGAYNRRYMAWNPPAAVQDSRPGRGDAGGVSDGRGDSEEGFSVDPTHVRALGARAAWLHQEEEDTDTGHDEETQGGGSGRSKRRGRSFDPTPWECEGRVRWINLGPDYFPPFLRSVECEQRRCWYDKYECRPRAFAVKLLRRIPGECTDSPPPALPSGDGTNQQQRSAELWIWEERAVAFCCECALVS